MKKILVVLLFGLFMFPAAFAQAEKESLYNTLLGGIVAGLEQRQRVETAYFLTKRLFEQYPQANLLPDPTKTFAYLSYEERAIPAVATPLKDQHGKDPQGNWVKSASRAKESPAEAVPLEEVVRGNGPQVFGKNVPAVLIPTESRRFGFAVIPVEVFEQMRTERIYKFSLVISLNQLSNGRIPATKPHSYSLGESGCPEGAKDISADYGICVFPVRADNAFDSIFEKFCETLEGKLLPSKVAAAFKK